MITGSHPEYVTRRELDALEEFTANGGRLMYLGGNGFFATVSYDPDAPHLMELRRADGGTRPHQSPFAERRHTTSGEAAGLWRNKGKAPQRLVGVGMAAQGFDRCTYYERLADSQDPRAAFVFEGDRRERAPGRLRHHRRRRGRRRDRLLEPGARLTARKPWSWPPPGPSPTTTCW